MKFISFEFEDKAAHEYSVYTCLGSIDNTQKNAFGIPSVYYYGWWKEYIMLATTLLDVESNRRIKNFQLNELDILIIFRELVCF